MSKIIDSVKNDLEAREQRGLGKYGTTVDRTDLSELEWLQHAYEEALDLAVYLKKVISDKNEIKYKYKKGERLCLTRDLSREFPYRCYSTGIVTNMGYNEKLKSICYELKMDCDYKHITVYEDEVGRFIVDTETKPSQAELVEGLVDKLKHETQVPTKEEIASDPDKYADYLIGKKVKFINDSNKHVYTKDKYYKIVETRGKYPFGIVNNLDKGDNAFYCVVAGLSEDRTGFLKLFDFTDLIE